MSEPPRFTTLEEALAVFGHRSTEIPFRPFLHGREGILLTIATLDEDGTPSWTGMWIGESAVTLLGSPSPSSLLSQSHQLSGPAATLVDLIQAAMRSYSDRLEIVGARVDALESRADPGPIAELARLQRDLTGLKRHIGRIDALTTQLEGFVGVHFPGLEPVLPELERESSTLESLAAGLSQAARDLVGIRNAIESNRLAEAANELGRVSNRIATLANTSNLRMLGVAYLALALALISAVVLIPNTGATILGMPSAGWVPGIWVDVILIVLAIVPIVIVFSRPWVKQMLRGFGTYEARSAEGLSDLPEVPPQSLDRAGGGERLIRESP